MIDTLVAAFNSPTFLSAVVTRDGENFKVAIRFASEELDETETEPEEAPAEDAEVAGLGEVETEEAGEYQCPLCPKVVKSAKGLTQHLTMVHKETPAERRKRVLAAS